MISSVERMFDNNSWVYRAAHGLWASLPGNQETSNQVFRRLVRRLIAKRSLKAPVVLQIGAFDGKTGDPLHPLMVEFEPWQGVLVEPHPAAFRRLKQNYRSHPNLQLVNCAITDTPGECELYCVPKFRAWNWRSQVATLHREVFQRLHPIWRTARDSKSIHSECIAGITIEDLLIQTGIQHFDIVCVDTEGSDAMIVHQILDLQLKPAIIAYESWLIPEHRRQDLTVKLRSHGYSILESEPDTIAHRIEQEATQ